MRAFHILTFTLLVIWGVNWGLIGAFDWNLVNALFGGVPALERIIYVLVGISALYEAIMHVSMCRVCSAKTADVVR